ncbi:MAG: disulfide bond formation protein B [Rickettsiales bacterium]
MASWLVLGGAIALCVAVVAQYGFHLAPCHFCILERYPYGVLIVLGGLSLLTPRGGLRWRVLVALGFCALLATGLLGLVHTGIEEGVLQYKGGCVAQLPADASLEALRAAIATSPLVSCDTPMLRVLGLSMATWNSVWAALVALLVAAQYRFDVARHAG